MIRLDNVTSSFYTRFYNHILPWRFVMKAFLILLPRCILLYTYHSSPHVNESLHLRVTSLIQSRTVRSTSRGTLDRLRLWSQPLFLNKWFCRVIFLHQHSLQHFPLISLAPTSDNFVPTHTHTPTHDTCFEFVSTHISGEWHLTWQCSKAKSTVGKPRAKVTPACVITLCNVFVQSLSLSVQLRLSVQKRERNVVAILNLCQRWGGWGNKHIRGPIP